jgi:hypothetical protein
MHIEERSLLNGSQCGFRALHSTTLQWMNLTDHVILNFNNNMSTDAVFLDIDNSFDTTWDLYLLYKLSDLTFSISLIKRINSFLSQRNFRVSVEGEISTPRDMQALVPQSSVLSPTLYSLYINDTLQTLAVYLGIFAEDTCIHETNRKRGLCSQKVAARSQCYWDVAWALT